LGGWRLADPESDRDRRTRGESVTLSRPGRGEHEDLVLDQRYHLIPDTRWLVTIPSYNDQPGLRRVDLQAMAAGKK